MFSLPRRQSTSALPASPALSTDASATARKLTTAAPASARTTVETESPARETQADAESGAARPLGASALRSKRSVHADSRAEPVPRSLSRDFSLSASTPYTLAHESCSSLKDQFLRIKERFSGPGTHKSSTQKTPRVDPLPSSAIGEQAKAVWTDSSSRSHAVNTVGAESQPRASSSRSSDGSETPKEPKDRSAAAQQRQPTRVERWYVEDSAFRGVISCRSIERGASVVARIARIASTDELPPSASGRINPDVSLQWVERHVWVVTVSLPLSRAGELTEEHIALAHRIDQAIGADDRDAETKTDSSRESSADQMEAPASAACSSERMPGVEATAMLAPVFSTQPDSSTAQSTTANEANSADTDRDELASSDEDSNGPSDELEGPKDDSAAADDSSVSAGSSDASAVASLPLSWSMLSLHSSSDNVRHSTTGSTGTCEDDASAFPRWPAPCKLGWLKKKSGLSAWQARYFELKGNRLYYFASESDGIPRGAVVLDHAHVVRGKGDQAMAFSISSSSATHSLQIVKFSSRLTHQVHARKSIVLRVVEETEHAVAEWVTALNRASFYSNLAAAAPSPSSSFVYQSRAFPSPGTRKRKTAFSRFRSPSASSAGTITGGTLTPPIVQEDAGGLNVLEGVSVHHLGSVKYLQGTDPLLWEINPIDQLAIRKRAAQARTRSDYQSILAKYASTFARIYLPRPRPISLEQTLRDILPELFLINDTLYGGGDGDDNGLENIFEVLDTHIKRFASAQEERVRAVSALLQACARTISGGDSYFVVHSLLGNPSMILRPAEARGHPIEIAVSEENPSQFLITVFSAFSFHHIDDVENFDEAGSSMTPEPLLRVRTFHIQEFDFSSGKSTRWLRIHSDGTSDDSGGGSGGIAAGASGANSGGGRLNGLRGPWGKYREGAETRIGALLDALS